MNVLDFEKPIVELEFKIEELKTVDIKYTITKFSHGRWSVRLLSACDQIWTAAHGEVAHRVSESER